MDWTNFFDDILFAAIAAIGFSSISHTPRRVWLICAVVAAAAHSLRYLLMLPGGPGLNIIAASAVAAFVAGCLAVALAPVVKVPAEACLFPGLLPMIPGMYAYRAVAGLAGCLTAAGEEAVMHELYVLCYNGLTCGAIVLGMVIGANLPIFIFRRLSFEATR